MIHEPGLSSYEFISHTQIVSKWFGQKCKQRNSAPDLANKQILVPANGLAAGDGTAAIRPPIA